MTWKSDWTAEQPADIGSAWAARDDGEFVDRDGDGFAYRDLGVQAASGGAIGVEDHPPQPLAYLDAMCVGRGGTMRHNVTDFSADYAVLEMCIPAVYDTIAVNDPVEGR